MNALPVAWPCMIFLFRVHYSTALDFNILCFNTLHIVPFEKFHRIGGAPPETFPNVKYDAPEEVGGDRKCFDSPISK